jgi:hypothetical protein
MEMILVTRDPVSADEAPTITSSSGFLTGRGRSSQESTMLKTTVTAAMPAANELAIRNA